MGASSTTLIVTRRLRRVGRRGLLAVLMLCAGGAASAACASLAGLDSGGLPAGDAGDARSNAPGDDAPLQDASREADSHSPDVQAGDAEAVFDGNCNCGPDCSVVVASHLSDPGFLAADDQGVYWVNSAGDSVQGVEFGGSIHQIATDDGGSPAGIALTSTGVLWTDAELGMVFGCARASCSPSVVVGVGNGILAATSLGVAGDLLYFSADNFIKECALAATPSVCTPAIAAAAPGAGLMAVDPSDGYLGWSTTNEDNVFGCLLSGEICMASVEFTSSFVLAMHVVGTKIFWLETPTPETETLQLAQTDAPGSVALYTFDGGSPPQDFALDDSTQTLYWIDGDGTVWKAPGSLPGVPGIVATGPPGLSARVVVNDACVFWSIQSGSLGNGTVMAAPK
jgi:hypothetical protein